MLQKKYQVQDIQSAFPQIAAFLNWVRKIRVLGTTKEGVAFFADWPLWTQMSQIIAHSKELDEMSRMDLKSKKFGRFWTKLWSG